jgi:hypothetical protein
MAPDFFRSLRRLFRRPEEAPGRPSPEPYVSEALTREASAERAYAAWVAERLPDGLALLRERFGRTAEDAARELAAANAGFVRLDGPTTRGLMVRDPEAHFGPGGGAHLLDWMAARVRAVGYYRQHAEARSWWRTEGVERLERVHLKPRFAYDEQARVSDQRYGNITLEHRLWNGRSTEWRLVNNVYHDRSWTEALAFGELLERLLHPDPAP